MEAFVCALTGFFLRQGILWVQIRAVLSVYSPLVLLPAASNTVQTHTYRNTNTGHELLKIKTICHKIFTHGNWYFKYY